MKKPESFRKRRAALEREMNGDPWDRATPAWRKKRTTEFQTALAKHLPGLSDSSTAEGELRALLSHEPIETIRSAAVRRAVAKIRRHLEAIAETDGAGPVLQELFHRRHETGRDWELLKPIVECAHMLQVWRYCDGLDQVLTLFENEAAAETATYSEQGKTKWSGVWAIGALVALWERQTGKRWTSTSVKWEGERSRGTYLRDGFEFLGQAFELDGTVESAFNRWATERARAKVV